MTALERIDWAALDGDGLRARSLTQDWLRTVPVVAEVPAPDASTDPADASLAAALGELMADRLGQPPPPWAVSIGGVAEAVYLVRAAERMPRLRAACEAESPLPLRRRQFFAPANYLDAV